MQTSVHTDKPSDGDRCIWPTAEDLDEAARTARRAVVEVRHAAEDMADDAARHVRRHPLATVGASLALGLVAGTVLGFAVGRLIVGHRPVA